VPKILKRSLLGFFAGYAIYIVVVFIDIAVQQIRYGYSTFENFYVWIYPLTFPYLLIFWREWWVEGHLEDNLLTLCGGLLLIAGVVWANWKKVPR